MTTDKEQLEPCPLCKCEDVKHWPDWNREQQAISCMSNTCGLQVTWPKNKDVVAYWNTRPAPSNETALEQIKGGLNDAIVHQAIEALDRLCHEIDTCPPHAVECPTSVEEAAFDLREHAETIRTFIEGQGVDDFHRVHADEIHDALKIASQGYLQSGDNSEALEAVGRLEELFKKLDTKRRWRNTLMRCVQTIRKALGGM